MKISVAIGVFFVCFADYLPVVYGRNEFYRSQFSRRQLGYQGNLPEIPEEVSAILKLNDPSESLAPIELVQNTVSKLKALADIVVDMVVSGKTTSQLTPEQLAVGQAFDDDINYLRQLIAPDVFAKLSSIYYNLYKDLITSKMV